MMNLTTITVCNILEDAFPEIDWFVNDVPKEKVGIPNLPLGRIVEINGDYEGYASNDPTAYVSYIQVDVWVKDMKTLNQYYFAIDKAMRDEAVQCMYSQETHDPDFEDTRRIIKRYAITQRVV